MSSPTPEPSRVQLAVEVVACTLCGGTGERRWLGQHPADGPDRITPGGRVELCPRCDASGLTLAIVRTAIVLSADG